MKDGNRTRKIFPVILAAALILSAAPVKAAQLSECQVEEIKETSEINLTEVSDSAENDAAQNVEDSLEFANLEGELTEETSEQTEIVPEIETKGQSESQLNRQIEKLEKIKMSHLHNADCGYVEKEAEIPCDKNCEEKAKDGTIMHSVDCSYCPAVVISPCQYFQEIDEKLDLLREKTEENLKEKPEEDRKEMFPKEAEADGKKDETDNVGEESQAREKTIGNVEEPVEEMILEDREGMPEDTPEEMGKEAETEVSEEALTQTDETDQTEENSTSKNEPEYTLLIPAEVILNESSEFEVETKSDSDMSEGELILTVTGTTAREESENFALFLEGKEDVAWEYQLRIENSLLNARQNQVVLEAGNARQKVVVVPMQSMGKLPAGNYQGSLNFQIVYKKKM